MMIEKASQIKRCLKRNMTTVPQLNTFSQSDTQANSKEVKTIMFVLVLTAMDTSCVGALTINSQTTSLKTKTMLMLIRSIIYLTAISARQVEERIFIRKYLMSPS